MGRKRVCSKGKYLSSVKSKKCSRPYQKLNRKEELGRERITFSPTIFPFLLEHRLHFPSWLAVSHNHVISSANGMCVRITLATCRPGPYGLSKSHMFSLLLSAIGYKRSIGKFWAQEAQDLSLKSNILGVLGWLIW